MDLCEGLSREREVPRLYNYVGERWTIPNIFLVFSLTDTYTENFIYLYSFVKKNSNLQQKNLINNSHEGLKKNKMMIQSDLFCLLQFGSLSI